MRDLYYNDFTLVIDSDPIMFMMINDDNNNNNNNNDDDRLTEGNMVYFIVWLMIFHNMPF